MAPRYTTGLSAQERGILDAFVASEKPAVAVEDVLAVLPVSRPYANRILARLAEKGWLLRLQRGAYSVVRLGAPSPAASVEDAWPLAVALFSPGYISGWSAAEHWDLTEQIYNSIAVITARPQRRREHKVAGITFVCRAVDEAMLFGTTRVWSGSTPILVADPHRLVIDILAEPAFGGGGRPTLDVVRAYWKSTHADPVRLLEYAERYAKGVVFKRLGFTAETFAAPSQDWLERCRAGMSKGVSLLDPGGPKRGRIVTRWRLRINLPIDNA